MTLRDRLERVVPPLVLGCGLVTVYLATMAPGLTWANEGADGGDLITAAAVGGVAHPTGYPVYLLLASLFQIVPIGVLAYRTNLLSALCTMGAAQLVYATVRRALESGRVQASLLGGLAAGLSVGLAPLIWSQAVITEVYALNLLLIAALLYLLLDRRPASRLQNGLTGLVQGIAVGNQILALLMVPATLVCVTLTRSGSDRQGGRGTWRGWGFDARALWDTCTGLTAGLISYVALPVRAASDPPVDWGDPITPWRFLWLVSGRLYREELLQRDLPALWLRLQSWGSISIEQFGFAGLAIAFLGLVVFFTPSRLYLLTLWTALVYTLFAIQYDVSDWWVYLLPAWLALSVWIGLGIGNGLNVISRRWAYAGWAVGGLCLGYFIVLGMQHWLQVDASHKLEAETYGRSMMATAPARAILFAEGDQTVFSLWYFHYALHERPDLSVIAVDLLPFDWYRENLQHTYPHLVLPSSTQLPSVAAIREANPTRRACYPYFLEPVLDCQ